MKSKGRILFVVGYPLQVKPWAQQSTWYRVIGPGQALSKLGYQVNYTSWSQQEWIKELLREKSFKSVICHRVAYYKGEWEIFEEVVKKNGATLIMDFDDNIVDPSIVDEALHLQHFNKKTKEAIRQGAYAFQQATARCDRVVVSTNQIVEFTKNINPKTFLLNNYIPEFYCSLQNNNLFLRKISGFSVFYGPGSLEHRVFFNLIKKPLEVFFAKHKNATLVLGGGLSLDCGAKINTEQILRLPRVEPTVYMSLLEKFNLVVAPLSLDKFAIAKSWIKVLEPAYQGVSWLASDVPNYREFKNISQTGELAASTDQWIDALELQIKSYESYKNKALLLRQNVRFKHDMFLNAQELEKQYLLK